MLVIKDHLVGSHTPMFEQPSKHEPFRPQYGFDAFHIDTSLGEGWEVGTLVQCLPCVSTTSPNFQNIPLNFHCYFCLMDGETKSQRKVKEHAFY